MKTKLKLIALSALAVLGFGALFAPATFATGVPAINCSDTSIPQSVRDANGCTASTATIENTIGGILNAVILISGLVAVVFVIIGGIGYITSAGDAGKLKKAKDTILYALIGIVVCALAYAIVNWVILKALAPSTTTGETEGGALIMPADEYIA